MESKSEIDKKNNQTFENSDIFNEIITSSGFISHIEKSLIYDFTNELTRTINGLTFTDLSGKKRTIDLEDVSLGELKVSHKKLLIPVSAIVRDRIHFEINASG